MNRNRHRIIFNKARGQQMAVAETGHNEQGGAAGSEPGAPPARRLTLALSALRLGVMAAVGSLVWVMPASAQVVVDRTAPASQQPTLVNAPNGVPVVNIQTPSAGGVSRNTYQQFDVNAQGLILNNSATRTESQLGGPVRGNELLAGSGSARVILNEVNSPYASQLRGTIEVAGQRAQVVVANPAGITCDGCGFINANRATLTTGAAIVQDGVLKGYQVRDGVVRIDGGGLNASQADFTDIIARAVQVNGELRANDLRVTAGRNEVDAAHRVITPLQAEAGDASAAPAVAIDVAQLGGMYAGRIRLVGTEAGVGVRNAGTLGASVGDVAISSEGWLGNTGTIHAASAARIQVAKAVQNQGAITAQGHVQVQAQAITSTADSLLAAGMAQDQTLSGSGSLELLAKERVRVQGQNLASQAIVVDAASIDLSGSQTQAQRIDLTARQSNIDATGASVHADKVLRAQAVETLSTDQAKLSADELQISAFRWSNREGSVLQTGAHTLSVNLIGSLDNRGGQLTTSQSDVQLHLGKELDNSEGLVSAGHGLVVTAGHIVNRDGEIFSQGGMVLNAQKITNTGIVAALGDLRLETSDLLNNSGLLLAQEDVTLRVGRLLNDAAGLVAAGTGDGPGDLEIVARNELQVHGTLTAMGSVRLRAPEIDLSGANVAAVQDADLVATSGGIDKRNGTIWASNRLSARGTTLDNEGGWLQGGQMDLQLNQLSNLNGTLFLTGGQSNRIVSLELLDNRGGAILSYGGTLVLDATTLDNTNGSISNRGNRLEVRADTLNSAQGGLVAGDLHLQLGSGRLDGGYILADSLQLTAQNFSNADGFIFPLGTGKTLIDVSGTLDNRNGTIFNSLGDLDVRAGELHNAGGFVMGRNVNLITRGDIDNTSGFLWGTNQLQIHAAGIDNRAGQLIGAYALSVDAATFSNTADGSVRSDEGTVDLKIAGLLLNEGAVFAGSDLTVHSDELINVGTLRSKRDMTLAVQGHLSHEGVAAAGRNLQIQAGVIKASEGSVLMASVRGPGEAPVGDLRVVAREALSVHGDAIAAAELNFAAPELDLAGSYLSAQDVVLTARAGDLNASSGTLRTDHAFVLGDSVTVQAQNWSNVGGSVWQLGDDAWQVVLPGTLDNTGGSLVGFGENMQLSAASIRNMGGSFEHWGSGLLSLEAKEIDNTRGSVQGSANVHLKASDRAVLDQGLVVGSQIMLRAGTVTNVGGKLVQGSEAGAMDVLVTGLLDNRDGVIVSTGDAQLSAGQLDNTGGTLSAFGNLGLDVTTTLRNVGVGQGDAAHGGSIFAGADLHLRSGDLVQQGVIRAGTVDLAVDGLLDNRGGLIQSTGASTLQAGRIDNRNGRLVSDATLDVRAGRDVNNSAGVISGRQGLTLTAASLRSVGGTLESKEGVVTLDIGGDSPSQ